MSLPRYEEYRNTGLDWLPTVPSHWEVCALKRVASLKSGETITSERISETGEFAVYGGNGLRGFTSAFTHEGTFALVGRQGALCGNVNYSNGKFWASEHAVVATPIKPAEMTWLGELLRAMDLNQYSVSAAQPGLSVELISNIGVPYPPLIEQTRIAIFLNRETAKIDALIAEQEKLIVLLTEKRQTTISHAVTKGINPNVPMKDSGVAWLGEVPAHWKIKPLRYCVDYQEGPGILADDFRDEGVPLLRVSGVQSQWATLEGCNYLDPHKVSVRWPHFRLKKGDLLISASASMGTICEVGDEAEGAVAYTGIIRLRGKDGEMVKDYVRHMVVSRPFLTQIDLLKTGATIQHYGPTHLSQMFAVCPPVEEQQEIALLIDQELSKLDLLCNEAKRAVELLYERRGALIAAAVTGQIDVRGAMLQSAVRSPEAIAA